jgi:primosomal replication protein N
MKYTPGLFRYVEFDVTVSVTGSKLGVLDTTINQVSFVLCVGLVVRTDYRFCRFWFRKIREGGKSVDDGVIHGGA